MDVYYMIDFAVIEKPEDLIGTVVIPKRGRDRDKPSLILGWTPDEFALIADGRLRKVARPKKKNIKHLVFTKCRPEELCNKFLSGEQVTDKMIRKELAAFGELTGEGRQYG